MADISTETYRALFESSPDATLLVDAHGRIVLANAQAEQMFGWSRADLLGRDIETLIPQRLREAHLGHRAQYVRAPGVRPMGGRQPLIALRADGSEFPVEIALGPMRSGERALYATTLRDVSELQRTRQAAARGHHNAYIAQFGMRALEQPDFATLIDAAAPLVAEAMQADVVVVFRLTPDRRELTCVSSYGITAEQAARMRAPNDRSHLPGYLVAVREPVLVPDIEAETRFRIIDVVRELGLRSALCVPLYGAGEVIGGLTARNYAPREWGVDEVHFMQAIANILATAIQRATTEEALHHAHRLDALGQLTGGVAHDFNNLLMVIVGNLQMLEDLSIGKADELGLARQAIGAAERAALLTRKLLAFARKQRLNPRNVDLSSMITEFRELILRTFGEQVAIQLDLDPALPCVAVDAMQLETALLNLALNARDAMPKGGTLRITTRRARIEPEASAADQFGEPGEYAQIAVADDGTGMTPEVCARAIDPFFTTKEAGKGSGLGLSMVYGFVRQSSGTVRIESQLGAGTTVSLYLPLPLVALQSGAAGDAAALPAGSETVLVVEDDAPVRRIAVAFLERLGYQVLQAPDAEGALHALRAHPGVDVLFTDIPRRGMNGVDLALQARALHPRIALLFTSGYASGATLDRVAAADREFVLAKPYRREDLAFMLRRALAARAA